MSQANSSHDQLLRSFRAFCEQAEPAWERSRSKPPTEQFLCFVHKSGPLLRELLKSRLRTLQEILQSLEPWLIEERHDVLDVARVTSSEDRYTELLAWTINPHTHSQIGAVCQRAWLKSLGITLDEEVKPVPPVTQFLTDNGIPDMVLAFPNLLVIVEAKTGTEEHKASDSTETQTNAYPSAVRHRLNKPDDFPTRIVYLTIDRDEAKNPDAIKTSYFEFAVTLARTLNGIDFPKASNDLKTLYKLVISHFATRTVGSANLRALLLADAQSGSVDRIAGHVASLTHLLSLLPEGTAQ